MPHTASASKRLRQADKRRKQNRTVAKNMKLKRRELDASLAGTDKAKTETDFKATQAVLDRAATKGYIHPNKAARLKSRLVKRVRAQAAKA